MADHCNLQKNCSSYCWTSLLKIACPEQLQTRNQSQIAVVVGHVATGVAAAFTDLPPFLLGSLPSDFLLTMTDVNRPVGKKHRAQRSESKPAAGPATRCSTLAQAGKELALKPHTH